MRKVQDFSVIQILREINFREGRSSKTAILGTLDFVDLGEFYFKKCKNAEESKSRASECVKMTDFALLESSN